MKATEKRDILEIDIKRLLLVLWQRLWIILLVAVLAGGLAFGYAWMFITPTYQASTQIYVNNQQNDSSGFSSSQLSAAQDLAYTYMVILESRNVLNDVAEMTGFGYSYEQMKDMIRSSTINSTEVFRVVVECANYKHAATIANAIAEVLPDKIAAVVDGSSVRVVDYAVEDPNPVAPSYQRYLMVGGLIGFVLSALIVIAANLMDTTINSEDYLSQVYGKIPLLAVIPGPESSKSGYYKGHYEYTQKSRSNNRRGDGKK